MLPRSARQRPGPGGRHAIATPAGHPGGEAVAPRRQTAARGGEGPLGSAAARGSCSRPRGPAARDGGDLGRDQPAWVTAGRELLAGYHEAVAHHVHEWLVGIGDADLDKVVDPRWDPPVTLGVRLVSVLADALQHVGQAAYVRGLAERAGT